MEVIAKIKQRYRFLEHPVFTALKLLFDTS